MSTKSEMLKKCWAVVSLVLIFSLLLGLAACNKATTVPPAPTVGGQAAQPTAISQATTKPERPFEGVTITTLQETVPDLNYWRDQLPDFEARTGIKVIVEEVTYAGMHEKLVPQLSLPAGQGAYDVIEVDKQWVGEFVCADWLTPIGDYIARDNFDTSVYIPALWEMIGSVYGTTYMLPYYQYSMGLVYRTDIFNDAILQKEYERLYNVPLKVPESVDEYDQVAKFLTRDTNGDGEVDQYGTAMQLARFPSYGEFSHLLFGLDGWYYDSNWKAAVNDEKGMHAIDTLLDLAKNATTPAATGYNFDEQVALFSQGNAAMIITYSPMPPVLDNPANSQVAGKIGLAVTPGGHGMQGGWGWAIPKSAPNPDAAWEFLKWVESFDVAKKRGLSGGGITRTDVFDDPEVMAKYPWQASIKEWIATGKPFPIFCGSQQLIDILSLNVSQALAGEKDPHQAMDDAAVEMNKIVEGDPLLNK